MTRLKLDLDTLGLSSIMERITGVKVLDCFKDQDDETIYFIIASGQLGKALGKGCINLKRVQFELNGKKIKLIEFRENSIEFLKNVIYPLQVQEIIEESDALIIKDNNKKTKSLLIGRDGKNLTTINRAVKRFFNKEVKVL